MKALRKTTAIRAAGLIICLLASASFAQAGWVTNTSDKTKVYAIGGAGTKYNSHELTVTLYDWVLSSVSPVSSNSWNDSDELSDFYTVTVGPGQSFYYEDIVAGGGSDGSSYDWWDPYPNYQYVEDHWITWTALVFYSIVYEEEL